MRKVLCVDDSEDYRRLVKTILRDMDITFATSVAEAKNLLKHPETHYEIMLLDISLPDGSGLDFLSEIRSNSVPINCDITVVVSSDSSDLQKVEAFGLDVDDYICKPFSPIEFRARIYSRLKKHDSQDYSKLLVVGDIKVNPKNMSLYLGKANEIIDSVTMIEFKLFVLLSQNIGGIYTREMIIENVWPTKKSVSARVVDAHICRLRKKIMKSNVRIESIAGVGYKLCC